MLRGTRAVRGDSRAGVHMGEAAGRARKAEQEAGVDAGWFRDGAYTSTRLPFLVSHLGLLDL